MTLKWPPITEDVTKANRPFFEDVFSVTEEGIEEERHRAETEGSEKAPYSAITAETEAREAADTTLHGDITAEETARETAVANAITTSEEYAAANTTAAVKTEREAREAEGATKAPVNNAHLTGIPTVPTAAAKTNTTQAASTAFAEAAKEEAEAAATADVKTEKEARETEGATKLSKSANLSDLANASTARTNLGLGTAATKASTEFDAAGAATTAETKAISAAAEKSQKAKEEAEANSVTSAEKGAASGIATLDSESHVTASQIPPFVVSTKIFKLEESVSGNVTPDLKEDHRIFLYTSSGAIKVQAPINAPSGTSGVVRLFIEVKIVGNATITVPGVSTWLGVEPKWNYLTETSINDVTMLSDDGGTTWIGVGEPEETPGRVGDLFTAASGYIAQTFDPAAETSSSAPTAGDVHIGKLMFPSSVNVHRAFLYVFNPGAGLVENECFAYLMNSKGEIIAQTPSLHEALEEKGLVSVVFEEAPKPVTGGTGVFGWLGLYVNGVTMPDLFSGRPGGTELAILNGSLPNTEAKAGVAAKNRKGLPASIEPQLIEPEVGFLFWSAVA